MKKLAKKNENYIFTYLMVLLFTMLIILQLFAPVKYNLPAETIVKSYFKNDEIEIAYVLYLPKNFNVNKRYNFVIFLHGAGDIGKDHDRILKIDYGFISSILSNPSLADNTIILVPQCPQPYTWVNENWATGQYEFSKTPSPPLLAVKQLSDQICKDYPVDKSKIYVSGVSMGGMATWDLIARYPNYFAAAAPICGCLDPSQIEQYLKTPIFTCNDIRDIVINANPTKNTCEKLENLGADIVYKPYDTSIRNDSSFHSSWIDAFLLDKSENNVYNFLFSKTKKQINQNVVYLAMILIFHLLICFNITIDPNKLPHFKKISY